MTRGIMLSLAGIVVGILGPAAWAADPAAPASPPSNPAPASPAPAPASGLTGPAAWAAAAEAATPLATEAPPTPAPPAPVAPAVPPPPAAPAVAAPVDKAAEDAEFTQRLKEVRLIEIRHLRSKNSAEFQKGREKLLALADEKYCGPMVNVLYGTNAQYRGVLIEALGKFAGNNSKVAQAYLQEVAVGDGSGPHRRKAVECLGGWSGECPSDRLLGHLAMDEVPVLRDRAATALATLQDRRAVWLMVERLVTEDVRVVGGEVWNGTMQMDLRVQSCEVPTFRQATVTAAVPGLGIATATIDLPQVRVIDAATTIAMTDKGHVAPDIQRTRTEHPEILAALKALTKQDFGYNQAAWQRWLQSEEGSKVVPAWQPVKIGG